MQIKFLCISLLVCIFSLSTCALTAEERFYESHSDPLKQFQSTLQQARESNTLVLLIIGANWCHDSRALAKQMQSNSVNKVLTRHYSPMVVNAGWLTDLSPLLAPLGHPAYFGTPSVFIIDPEHQIILNRGSVQRWQSAHSESSSSLAHYLALQKKNAAENSQRIRSRRENYQQKVDEIVAFEQQQAARLYQAYALIGPKLADESKSGQGQDLEILWEEVRRFRYKLQHDLVNLYQSLDAEAISIPEYQRLSFE
ncbi:thioredoxin family protein [Alteromonas ponticola]|uniref:Thioredoxin family protein n=1 Tax=Alteromonas ponticola TaxID=2720613 RepID=A0ABX1R689_9ALTE|nr:thioredoxin family protein [Alteromonas ponticola]NMH61171.1 thioredoxin family protein [Alteromonas ponticola]